MNRNKMACDCRRVTYGAIEDAVKKGASTFEQVQQMTGCGKACGKCLDFVRYLAEDLIREHQSEQTKEE